MVIYILKKILTFTLILFLLAQISFCIAYFSPDMLLNQLTIIDAYKVFFQQILQDQFTLSTGETIAYLHILSATFELCLLALLLSLFIGIPVGIFVGLNNIKWLNNLIKIACLIIYSCPLIWLVVIVMFALSRNWPLFINFDLKQPITGISLLDILITPHTDKWSVLFDQIQYLLLPTIILAIQPCIITIELFSQNVKKTAQQNFIKMAIIREISPFKILRRHFLPNLIPTTIPQLTYNATTLLFSTMVLEIMFKRAGLGQWIMTAYHQSDYNIIAIAILACGTIISSLTLLSDILAIVIYPMRHKENYV